MKKPRRRFGRSTPHSYLDFKTHGDRPGIHRSFACPAANAAECGAVRHAVQERIDPTVAPARLCAIHHAGGVPNRRARCGRGFLWAANAGAASPAIFRGVAVSGDYGLAGFSGARGDARHQPGQGSHDGDAVCAGRFAGRVEDQSASALHGTYLRLPGPRRGLAGRQSHDWR